MRMVLSILLLFSIAAHAQNSTQIFIQQLPQSGILLDKDWRFQAGDNPEWAKLEFDDSHWQAIDLTKDIHDVSQLWKDNIVWFRLHLTVDSALVGRLALTMREAGACEMYLDGHLVHRLGVVSKNPDSVKAFNPLNKPLSFPVKAGNQVLAIRYALQPRLTYSYF